MLHRNSQKRIYAEGATYFVTSVTYHRHAYFNEPLLAELLVCDLWFCRELKEFEIYGYNVLPDHAHLLIQPTGRANYSEIMGTLKRIVARDINDMITGRPFIRNIKSRGDDSNRRLRMNFQKTKTTHANLTIQTCELHFCSLSNLRERFLKKYGVVANMRRFRWQKSFRDHIIRNGRDFDNHLDYIYNNAVKHGLADEPEAWPWMWVYGMSLPSLTETSEVNA